MKSFKRMQMRYIVAPFVIGGLLLAVVFLFLYAMEGYGVIKRADNVIANTLADEQLYLESATMNSNIAMYVVQKNGEIIVQKEQAYQGELTSSLLARALEENKKAFAIDEGRFKIDRQENFIDGNQYLVTVIYDFTEEFLMLYELSQITILSYFLCLIILGVCCYIMSVNALRPVKEAYFKQRQLIADASHEIKTPITVVSANLQLMASDPTSTIEANKKWMESCQNQTKRMSNLILQLLELSSLEEGKFIQNYQKIDISELCFGVVLSFEAIAFEKKIVIKSDIQQGLLAKGSIIEFEKLITILIDNALKYTNMNGEISVDLRKEGKRVSLKVTNTGDGIALDRIPYIFERFYKLDNAHQESGNSFGLGLSIAKTIAQNMKGNIECVSEVGAWTRFEVTLPGARENEKRNKENGNIN